MKKYWSVALLITVLLIATSFYLQYGLKLAPCPLCIMQRLCVILLALIFAIGIWCCRCRLVLSLFAQLISLGGLYFAGRQVWLQYFQSADGQCGPSFEVLVKYMPTSEVIKALFLGSGDCAHLDWTLFGFSLAVWSALAFLLLEALASVIFVQGISGKR